MKFFTFVEILFRGSRISNAVLNALKKIGSAYKNSYLDRIFSKFGDNIKKKVFLSSSWNTFSGKDRLTVEWKDSIIYRITYRLLNTPALFARKFYERHEGTFSGSYTFKVVKSLLRKFEILTGLCLALIVIVPHDRWNNAYSSIIIFFLLLLYFVKTVVWKYMALELGTLDFMFFIFILSVVLAALLSVFPALSIKYLLFYISCFILLLIMTSSIKNGRNLERLIEIFLVGITITGLYGIWQRMAGVPFDPSFTDPELNEGMLGRVFSTMGNPNNYAEVLVMTLPFYLTAIFNSRTTVKKIVYGILAVPPLAALIFTGSRSGWVAFAFSLFIVMFFKNWKLIPFILAAGVLAFPLMPFFAPSVYRRILTIFNPNDSSANYRTLIWNAYMPMFKDFWTTGVGLGSLPFMRILQRYELSALSNVTPPHTHNLFMEIWMEMGLAGIISFIWFTLRMFRISIYNIFSKSNTFLNNILIAGLASVGGIFVMGFAEYVWFYNRTMLIFWTVIGIILACLTISSNKDELSKKAAG